MLKNEVITWNLSAALPSIKYIPVLKHWKFFDAISYCM